MKLPKAQPQGEAYRNSANKRRLDTAVALSMAAMLAPAATAVALEIMVENKSLHPLYVAQRRGKNGAMINMYQFRTMWKAVNVADPISGAEDPRVSDICEIWRRTRIDHYPGIWNILKGDDSVCGPRRMEPAHEKKYEGIVGEPKMDQLREVMAVGTGHMTREQIGTVYFPSHDDPAIINWRIDGAIRYGQDASLREDLRIIQYGFQVLGGRLLGLMQTPPTIPPYIIEVPSSWPAEHQQPIHELQQLPLAA